MFRALFKAAARLSHRGRQRRFSSDTGSAMTASRRRCLPPGTPGIDTEKARQTGAAIGEKVATGAAQAEQALSEGALTAKIKSKMALDDTVKALSIDVDTKGTVVTLSGSVTRGRARQGGSARARNRRRDGGQRPVGVKQP